MVHVPAATLLQRAHATQGGGIGGRQGLVVAGAARCARPRAHARSRAGRPHVTECAHGSPPLQVHGGLCVSPSACMSGEVRMWQVCRSACMRPHVLTSHTGRASARPCNCALRIVCMRDFDPCAREGRTRIDARHDAAVQSVSASCGPAACPSAHSPEVCRASAPAANLRAELPPSPARVLQETTRRGPVSNPNAGPPPFARPPRVAVMCSAKGGRGLSHMRRLALGAEQKPWCQLHVHSWMSDSWGEAIVHMQASTQGLARALAAAGAARALCPVPDVGGGLDEPPVVPRFLAAHEARARRPGPAAPGSV